MRWRILYTDETVFSNTDGNPEDAPGCGVVAIAVEDPKVNCRVHTGTDLYVYHEIAYGGWMGMDRDGFVQHVMCWREPVIVKFGQAMDTTRYLNALARFREAGLNKTSRYEFERKGVL